MNVLVSGSTGLIGSALVGHLTAGGHSVTRLTRSRRRLAGRGSRFGKDAHVQWDPAAGKLKPDQVEGFDAVVHLAGENIAARRWTAGTKTKIRDSRVHGTRLLSETLAGLSKRPSVLVCASAIGYYGDRDEEVLNEGSTAGSSFLASVCQAWESAADPARQAGVRVVNLRFGTVLSSEGGALAKLLLPFRLGLGGRVGSGHQYMAWIALDDAVRALSHALVTGALKGPANAVAPQPVTNREFTEIMARVLDRPAVLPVPALALRLVLGEMADELLLASTRVEPARLLATGFEFRYPDLEGALRHLLGKNEGRPGISG